MIGSIIVLAVLTHDDSAGAAVARPGGWHGILAVVSAVLERQPLFKVPKNDSVPTVGKWPASLDQRERIARFCRQFGEENVTDLVVTAVARKAGRRGDQACQSGNQQNPIAN